MKTKTPAQPETKSELRHPPVFAGLSLAAAAWPLNPLAKFALVGAAACACSFAASLLRTIPGARGIL